MTLTNSLNTLQDLFMLIRFFNIIWANNFRHPDNATLNIDDDSTIEMQKLLEDTFNAPVKSFKCEKVTPFKEFPAYNPTLNKENHMATKAPRTPNPFHSFRADKVVEDLKDEKGNFPPVTVIFNKIVKKMDKEGELKMGKEDSYYSFLVGDKLEKVKLQKSDDKFEIDIKGVVYSLPAKEATSSKSPAQIAAAKEASKEALKAAVGAEWAVFEATAKKLLKAAIKKKDTFANVVVAEEGGFLVRIGKRMGKTAN